MAPVQRPGPQVRALTLTAVDALHAENRAAAARLRACRELFALCEDEQFDRAVAAGYGAGLEKIQREVADWLLDAINSGRRPGRDAILDEADSITRKYDPEGVLARRERAHEERNLWLRRGRDGMADLTARISALDAQAIFEALGTISRRRVHGPAPG